MAIYKIGNKIIPEGVSFSHGEYQYPANWIELATEQEKTALGLELYVEPTPVPSVVSMRQARLALLQQGLLSSVNTAIESIQGAAGDAARVEWEYAAEVKIDSPLVVSLGSSLGLTQQQINDLFILANTF
jgi:hypothetical protein